MPGLTFQAMVLAGGCEDKALHPVTAPGTAKALSPVCNKALLSYPLRFLRDAGLKHAFVVVSGERAAAGVQAWLHQEWADKEMHCEVVSVPEDFGSADAIRAVAPRVNAPACVVLSGDLLTDLPLRTLVAGHQLSSALATLVLYKRKVPPSMDTKPGKAPKNVDYVGLDASQQHLLFYASSPETLRDLRVPLSVVKRLGSVSISSDLANSHLYVLNRSVLDLLAAYPKLSSIRRDLLPFLALNHRRLLDPSRGLQGLTGAAAQANAEAHGSSGAQGTGGAMEDVDGEEGGLHSGPEALPGADYMGWSHRDAQRASPCSSVHVHIIQSGAHYCARVDSTASYSEVNREVADSSAALHLSGLTASAQHDNIVPHSTAIGAKASVTSGCVLGEGCTLGDKASIKRSVLGSGCRLGMSAKIINSVLQANVVVGDGCTVQNSILCTGVHVRDRATVKDCQVGRGYVLAGGEHKDEVLASKPAHP